MSFREKPMRNEELDIVDIVMASVTFVFYGPIVLERRVLHTRVPKP